MIWISTSIAAKKWDELGKSHAKDITVHYPDGHTTKGLDNHIEELKPMFVFAPDTKIKEHPIRIASGEWTAVSGTLKARSQNQCQLAREKPFLPLARVSK